MYARNTVYRSCFCTWWRVPKYHPLLKAEHLLLYARITFRLPSKFYIFPYRAICLFKPWLAKRRFLCLTKAWKRTPECRHTTREITSPGAAHRRLHRTARHERKLNLNLSLNWRSEHHDVTFSSKCTDFVQYYGSHSQWVKKAVRKCVKDIFIQEELAIQTPSGGGDRNKMNGLKLRAIAGNLFWYAPGELYFNVTMMLYFLSFRFRFRYSAMPGTSFQREWSGAANESGGQEANEAGWYSL